MQLPLLAVLVAVTLGCDNGGTKYRDGEEWIKNNAYKMKCKMDNHSSWSVQVTACLSVDGIEIPVNQVKTVGPYELECKIASEGYPYLKTVVGKKADCMGGHPHGSEWIEKSFRFRCDKRGKSRFVGCIAGDGSLLLDGETKTIGELEIQCKKHGNGTVTMDSFRKSLGVYQKQDGFCRDSMGNTRRNGETWIERGGFVKECRDSRPIAIGRKTPPVGTSINGQAATALPGTQIDTENFELSGLCAEPLHLGDSNCPSNKRPSIMWHMDKETLTCLAFKYSGCGGNSNRFSTIEECQRTCLPADFQSCPANSKPVKRADNTSHCTNNGTASLDCPRGAVCKMGYGVGLCCDSQISARVNANYQPDCGRFKKLYKSPQFGDQLIHLGKSCDHGFCPTAASCHRGDYFAYCCQ